MYIKTLFASLAIAALAFTLTAAEEKKAETKKSAGPLQPQMEPEGGWEKAMGTLGDKPAEPWTATTIGAGVDKKPLTGKVATVTGEVIDLSCYLQLGKHGEKHKACGQKCLAAGQPIGLLAKDGSIYMLMEEEHDPRRDGQVAGFRKAAIEHFGQIMQVSGTEATVKGYHAVYVQGFVSK